MSRNFYTLLILNNSIWYRSSRIFHSLAIKSSGSVVTHKRTSGQTVLHSVGVFSRLSHSLLFLVSLLLLLSAALLCLLLLSFPFFLAFPRLVRDQHSQSLCHRGLIHHKYKLTEHSRVCTHK